MPCYLYSSPCFAAYASTGPLPGRLQGWILRPWLAVTQADVPSAGLRDLARPQLCGDPYAHEVHWTGTAYEECTGKGCQHCAGGIRSSLRVAFNVFVVADGTVKIMEGGARWFTDVLKVRNKYGLGNYAFEIERHGAAGSPKTTYSILPDVPLDQGLRVKVAAAKLHDLRSEDVQQTFAREAAALPTPAAAANAMERAQEPFVQPIDIDPAREIHQQLKRMGKPDVDSFMAHFGIAKVTDLKARDEKAARQFINERMTLL